MDEPLRGLLTGGGLRLEPVGPGHAPEMARVLADPALHEVTGGEPPSVDALRERYARWQRGSGSPDEEWRTWVVREGGDGPLVGFVQATLTGRRTTAEVAWVVGTPWQGRGLARRAAALVLDELRRVGVATVVAHVAPGHRASERVAAALGLAPTPVRVDGEVRWEAALPPEPGQAAGAVGGAVTGATVDRRRRHQ